MEINQHKWWISPQILEFIVRLLNEKVRCLMFKSRILILYLLPTVHDVASHNFLSMCKTSNNDNYTQTGVRLYSKDKHLCRKIDPRKEEAP